MNLFTLVERRCDVRDHGVFEDAILLLNWGIEVGKTRCYFLHYIYDELDLGGGVIEGQIMWERGYALISGVSPSFARI